MTDAIKALRDLLEKRDELRSDLMKPSADLTEICAKLGHLDSDLARSVPALIEIAEAAKRVDLNMYVRPDIDEALYNLHESLSKLEPSK
jgi:hypothetical protein